MNQILRSYPLGKYFVSTLLVCVWIALPFQLSAQIISTVAGNNLRGDGGPATDANCSPTGVAVDGNGNLYIVDQINSSVRKVTPGGVISTVAGNGNFGYSGDGGAATSAQLYLPTGVAVDGGSNLYIADLYNHRIRKVTPEGVISTVAGNGTYGYSGDGAAATSAQLAYPTGIAVDGSGNLFIAEQGRIRKVTAGGVISTVVGNGTQGYGGDGGPATDANCSPYGVAVDGNGNLYIVDPVNNRIRKVTPGGVISTVAGNGTQGYGGDGAAATSAQLNYPYGVAVDGNGNLYIADAGNNRIRKVTPEGNIGTVAGNGTYGYSGDGAAATSAQLAYPTGIAVDGNGNLYFAEQGNSRIRKVNPEGVISTVAGNGTQGYGGDGAAATSAQLYYPYSVAVYGSGSLYIADLGNNRIRKVSPPASVTITPANLAEICSANSFSFTATTTNITHSSYVWSSQPSGLTASGASATFTAPLVSNPTIYTITVTASDGILSPSASVTLTVNPQPAVTLSSSGTLTCAQTSVTLTAGGGDTYQFSGPNVMSQSGNVAVINVAGTYSVTVTGANGCTAIQTTSIQSNTTPSPLSLTASNPLNCSTTSVTLTATPGFNTYVFSSSASQQGGQGGNTAIVSAAGGYSVTAINASGCSSTATVSINYLNCPPTVATPIGPQSATLNQSFSMVIPANTFTDTETPNSLTLSVSGLPVGLSFVSPATISGTPSTTVGSPFSVTVSATDSGGLSAFTSFSLTVNSGSCSNMYSVKVGSWSDVSVWSCGRLPLSTDVVTLNHAVTLPVSYMGQIMRLIYNPGGKLLFSLGGQLRLAGN